MIAQLFTICINEHIIPKEWKITLITLIFEHGDRKNCDNYRAMSITSIFSRLFGRTVRGLIVTEYTDKEGKNKQDSQQEVHTTITLLFLKSL